jgi:hypothetical protein
MFAQSTLLYFQTSDGAYPFALSTNICEKTMEVTWAFAIDWSSENCSKKWFLRFAVNVSQ